MIKTKLSSDDLKRFETSLKVFIGNLEKDADDAMTACGRDYANKVRAEIGTHDPFVDATVYGELWARLSNSWISIKASRRHSLQMWSETGNIYRSVRVQGGYRMSTFSGITAEQDPDAFISAIHNEFGTMYNNKKVPARPLFMPVANLMTAEYMSGTGVYKYMVDALNIAVKRTW